MRAEYGDLTIFDQLRLDPYYRTTAARHPDLARSLSSLADDYARHCSTLVHGDWSPKNFLVGPAPAMAIDFEAIHFGDPAFDTAFLLNHLLLKSFHLPSHANDLARLANTFWTVTLAEMPPIPDFERRTIQHLGALLLARIDGKSPAEYIREQALRERIRLVARHIVLDPPACVREVFESCR
jgi:Ser/Thr protein kinase RdoA (MazF antagonist)